MALRQIALYRLRHVGVFVAAGVTLTAFLAWREALAAGLTPNGASAFAAVFAVALVGVLSFSGLKWFVAASASLAVMAAGQAAFALADLTAAFIDPGPTAFWVEGPWRRGLGLLLSICAWIALARARPLRRLRTEHQIDIAAPADVVFRTLAPEPDGAYWKSTLTVAPVPGRPDQFDFRHRALKRTAAPTRLQIVSDPSTREATFIRLVARDGVVAPAAERQTHWVTPIDGGSRIQTVFEIERPTLGFIALHALIDLPSDELRRLKAHMEALRDTPLGAFGETL